MISWTDTPLRVVILVQLLAMGIVRAYFGAPGRREPAEASPRDAGEPALLTSTLAVIAVLNFGAIFVYLMSPSLLRCSTFEASEMIRWTCAPQNYSRGDPRTTKIIFCSR